MRTLITPQAMRDGEARYFASSGVPSIEVMERAATALAGVIAAELPAGATIYFACGTGGNGGDGTACARLLHKNYNCIIVQLRPPKSPDAIANLRRAMDCDIAVAEDAAQLPQPAHFSRSSVSWERICWDSGLAHQLQRRLQPLKKTVVRMPGPSCRENF